MTVIYHPDYEKHLQHHGHPESPDRLRAAVAKLKSEDLFNVRTPKPATDKELGFVHLQSYIDEIRNFGEGNYDMDTYVRPETFGIASLAAGGALLATKYSCENGKPSFALLRPPGHHAGADYAGGFCYFNNIAVGAQWLAMQKKKVAIVDIDVHHGNGTADIFCDRADVLYISTHLYGIYPGTGAASDTGEGDGKGFTVNIPFRSGCGDASFKAAFDDIVEPVVAQFKPDAVLVSLGGDSHYRDTLGSLTLSTPGYINLARRLVKMAQGKCAFMLEGGYDVDALAEIIAGIVASFGGKEIPLKYTEVIDTDCAGRDIVKRVKEVQREFWKL
jgi:acetoin utilization deacetylase AcuC-like enzyme